MHTLGCIWLSEVRLAPVRQAALLRACSSGDEFLCMSSRRAGELCGGLTPKEAIRFQNKSLRRTEEILRRTEDLGGRAVTFYDDDFPAPLRHIPDPPAILYVRGALPDLTKAPAMAVIGKRKASAYGLQTAEKMGYALSRAGVVVVSGMAVGCDGAAHLGALKGGSPTIAVLGTPLDRCSPASHESLMQDIIRYGAVVTEYSLGRPYTASDFPRRNRLISGLALGVVVCEAARKSGTLQTAHQALEQGRDVFAVPGPIGAPNSEGTNELIASGCAQLVTSPQRVLDEYENRWEALGLRPCDPVVAPRKEVCGPEAPAADCRPAAGDACGKAPAPVPAAGQGIAAAYAADVPEGPQQELLAALSGIMHVDELIEKSGVPAADALQALTFLEITGLVRRLPGKRYERTY